MSIVYRSLLFRLKHLLWKSVIKENAQKWWLLFASPKSTMDIMIHIQVFDKNRMLNYFYSINILGHSVVNSQYDSITWYLNLKLFPYWGGKCKELAQETCYNKPTPVNVPEMVTLMAPSPSQVCGPMTVTLPTVKCEEVTEEK